MKALRLVLGLTMAGTLLAAVLAPDPASELVAPAPRAATNPARASEPSTEKASASPNKSTAVDVLSIRPRGLIDEMPGSSLFATVKRQQPVKVTHPVPQAPAPMASEPSPQLPPLPFRVLGRYVEDGEETVFLQHAEGNVAARVGDVLSGQYRVEGISAGVLTLTYLPLNQRQTLAIGDTP